MDKICKQTLHLLEDINPDSVNADDISRLALLDPDGVDALAEAVLVGGERWIRREPRIMGLDSDSWLTSFLEIINVVRRYVFSLSLLTVDLH